MKRDGTASTTQIKTLRNISETIVLTGFKWDDGFNAKNCDSAKRSVATVKFDLKGTLGGAETTVSMTCRLFAAEDGDFVLQQYHFRIEGREKPFYPTFIGGWKKIEDTILADLFQNELK